MRRVWYWAILDREGDGFIARIPDLGDLAAYGAVEKDAVAHVAQRAGEHVRALEESGQPVPAHASEGASGRLSVRRQMPTGRLCVAMARDMCCYRPSQHDAATKYLASLV